jgi:hypothetical protein
LITSLYLNVKMVRKGYVTYKYRVDAEEGNDGLEVMVDDDVVVERVSQQLEWKEQVLYVEKGIHVLRWQYKKNGEISVGADRAYIEVVEVVGTAVADTHCLPCALSTLDNGGGLDSAMASGGMSAERAKCRSCPADFYAARAANSALDYACMPCPPNHFSEAGAVGVSECIERLPCSLADTRINFTRCDEHNMRQELRVWSIPKLCNDSLPGSLQLASIKVQSVDCLDCDPGHHRNKIIHTSTAAGAVAAAVGAVSATQECEACPVGKFAMAVHDVVMCKDCAAGRVGRRGVLYSPDSLLHSLDKSNYPSGSNGWPNGFEVLDGGWQLTGDSIRSTRPVALASAEEEVLEGGEDARGDWTQQHVKGVTVQVIILKLRLAFGVPAFVNFTYHLTAEGMGGNIPVGKAVPGEKALHSFSFWVDGQQKYSSDEHTDEALGLDGPASASGTSSITASSAEHEDHVDQIVVVSLDEQSQRNIGGDKLTTLQWRFTRCADKVMDVRAVVEEVNVVGVASVGKGAHMESGGGVGCVNCPAGRYAWTPLLSELRPPCFNPTTTAAYTYHHGGMIYRADGVCYRASRDCQGTMVTCGTVLYTAGKIACPPQACIDTPDRSAECKACPAGRTSVAGHSECTACAADTFSFQRGLSPSSQSSDAAHNTGAASSESHGGSSSGGSSSGCLACGAMTHSTPGSSSCSVGDGGSTDAKEHPGQLKFESEHAKFSVEVIEFQPVYGKKNEKNGGGGGGHHGPVKSRGGEEKRAYYYNITAIRGMFDLRALADGTAGDGSDTRRRTTGTIGKAGITTDAIAAQQMGPMVVVRARSSGSGAGIADDNGGHVRQFHLSGLDRGYPAFIGTNGRASKLNSTVMMATMRPPVSPQGSYAMEIVLNNANASSKLVEKSLGTQGKMLCRVPPVYGASCRS